MSGKRKAVYVILGILATGLLAGGLIIYSNGYPIPKETALTENIWHDRTIDCIYEPFDTLDTDMDDYIWPTDITRIFTSAFGEFRTTHLHAGIDISTRGQIGAPVFAARSGYIERIGVSPFGYGKYILMRHEDGFKTLYAHLDSFDEPVERRVSDFQEEQKRYSVSLSFTENEFRYEKGEIIGLSGSTGSGPPHIHFEIRDRNNNPVNPKFSSEFIITDNVPPVFNRLAVIPADAKAFVNGYITPITLSPAALRTGEFALRSEIRASGTVGLAVDLHDRNDGTWVRHGVYSVDFFINDSLLYSVKYDRFPIEHHHQVRLHYDHFLLSSGRGRFQKLFIEEGNSLPLYDRREWGSGLLRSDELGPGPHDFRISAYDFQGNASVLTGSIRFIDSPVEEGRKFSPRTDNKTHINSEESGLLIRTDLFRNNLIIDITQSAVTESQGELLIRRGENSYTVPLIRAGKYRYQGRLELRPSEEYSLKFLYILGDTVYTHSATVYSISPGREGEIHLDDGNFSISYGKGAVYYPVFFTLNRSDENNAVSYSLNTTSSVLDEGIHLTIRVNDEIGDFDRSVLSIRENSRWNTLRSTKDYDERTLSAGVRRFFNDIKVFADTTAPSIRNVIVDGNRNLRIRFSLSDNESGIDHSSLVMKLDDRFLVGRYDPDLSIIIYRTREPVSPGRYNLFISAADRAGNVSEFERTVYIR